MKLYDCPNKTWVKVLKATEPPPGGLSVQEGEVVRFHHTDGMYSYCVNSRGQVVHLKAWTEVEVQNEA